jgi:hypothetical protein
MSLPELEEKRKSPGLWQAAGVVHLKLGSSISDNVSFNRMLSSGLELSAAVTAGARQGPVPGVVKQSGPGVPVELLGTFHLIGPVSANASQPKMRMRSIKAGQHAASVKEQTAWFFRLNVSIRSVHV